MDDRKRPAGRSKTETFISNSKRSCHDDRDDDQPANKWSRNLDEARTSTTFTNGASHSMLAPLARHVADCGSRFAYPLPRQANVEIFSPSLMAIINHQRQEESLRESRSQILEDLLRHRLHHYQAGIQPNLPGIVANQFLHQQHFEGVMTTPPSVLISGLSFGLNRTYPSLLPMDERWPDRSANTERVALATDPVWPGSMPTLASIPQLPPRSFPIPSRSDLRDPNLEPSCLFTLPPREFPPKRLPVILAIQDDRVKLSPRQAFLRMQIEAFEASEDEVAVHARGRNKKIKLRQVGIRCRYCAHLPVVMKQKGSTYFPATLAGLYQAGQNMCSIHFQSGRCKDTPAAVKRQFVSFMSTQGGGLGVGSPYWADAANQLGLVNSDDGIRFVPVVSSRVSKDKADSKTLAEG